METETIEYIQARARAKANGISAPTFRVRVVECNWSLERASTEPPRPARNITYVGKLCAKYGIQHSQYKRWAKDLPDGTPPEEIAQVAKKQADENASKRLKNPQSLAIQQKLKRYQELMDEAKKLSPSALAEEYGVSIGTVYRHMEPNK